MCIYIYILRSKSKRGWLAAVHTGRTHKGHFGAAAGKEEGDRLSRMLTRRRGSAIKGSGEEEERNSLHLLFIRETTSGAAEAAAAAAGSIAPASSSSSRAVDSCRSLHGIQQVFFPSFLPPGLIHLTRFFFFSSSSLTFSFPHVRLYPIKAQEWKPKTCPPFFFSPLLFCWWRTVARCDNFFPLLFFFFFLGCSLASLGPYNDQK